jgi:DNA-binding protein YbaB
MTTRNYSSRSQQTTLTSAVTAGASTIVVQSGAALLGGQSIPAGTTFTIVVDPDTALEEILDATAVSTNTFTVTRAIDGSSAQAHSAGAVVRHMAIGRDYRESNTHIEAEVDGVVVTIDGQLKVVTTVIEDKSILADQTRLEKALTDAVNKGMKKAQEIAADRMRGVMGQMGLNLPGM